MEVFRYPRYPGSDGVGNDAVNVLSVRLRAISRSRVTPPSHALPANRPHALFA